MKINVDTAPAPQSVTFSSSIVKTVEATKFRKPNTNAEERPPSKDGWKLFRTMRDAASVISFIISLLKILQELGLL